jgi:SAM-dependent methyltransferase
MLSSGVPTREEYLRLEKEPLYRGLLESSREFERKCQVGSRSAANYSKRWVTNPFQQWSRRWEYVYVAQRLSEWLADRSGPHRVVDAGSGFTFFPFYLMEAHDSLSIDCFDFDPVAGEALEEASEMLGQGPGFYIEDLEGLSQADESVDAVYSVSVIEHTPNPRAVIDEVNRVLRPGGLFVCTFDISFESRSPMYTRRVERLVKHIEDVFDLPDDWRPIDFDALPADESIVTTRWNAEAVASGLPWRRPRLVWLYDMLRGRFRAELYRPMTFCCLTLLRKSG